VTKRNIIHTILVCGTMLVVSLLNENDVVAVGECGPTRDK
jgi:glutamate 5-kinase